MNRRSHRILAALLAILLSFGALAACQPDKTAPAPASTATAAPSAAAAPVGVPLVVAEGEFSEQFSPFYSDSVYDADVMEMTQIPLLTTDRAGGIVYNAASGAEVSYNGTNYTYTGPCDIGFAYDKETDIATYTIKLKPGVLFSDGVEATADDIIFTYYVYADPSYVGSTTLSSYPIIGLKSYQTQVSEEVYAKYAEIAAKIQARGDKFAWSFTNPWTQQQHESYWSLVKTAWMKDLQDIVDYCRANYAAYIADVGKTEADLEANDSLNVALGMYAWGFAAPGKDGALVGATTQTSWDLVTTFPTMDDLYAEAYAKYEGDAATFFSVEAVDATASSTLARAQDAFIAAQVAIDPAMAQGVPNIEGIQKVDKYTVTVKTKGYEAPAIYTICGLYLTPMHYYGDPAQYDYDKNMFGHPFGDLSLVQAKTNSPMGAGPYRFVKYENRVVYFEANEHYYKGAPLIQSVQFKETADNEVIAGIATGTIDIGSVASGKKNYEEIAGYNSSGKLSGDVIETIKTYYLGYGYIGLNANNIRVGTDSGSEASRNLRKGLATILAVYRDVAYQSYFGESASVINYPISSTSWAAPQATDEGYRIAFSTDAEGKPIYLAGMTADEKYAAALSATVGYLKAAGYTYDESAKRFTAAPEGAKMSYEALISAEGIGLHPSFAVLTDAAAALATIGLELVINDMTDSSVMGEILSANTQEIWCSAWQATIDPDMVQTYHSSGIVGAGGSESNYYNISDPALDQLLMDARKSDDQAYRKAVYRQALDLIADWAVEIPAYQRQNSTVFSAQRVKLSSLTPDITTFWGWRNGIETLEMQ